MSEPQVLIVTSAGAPSSAVVPVLAAIEAAGMRVRAIDVGNAGGGGSGVADRVRRALMGEGAERRLRRELELSPPDAAVVFDPHAAMVLTVVRDQSQNPAPVIAVVGDLDPAAAWAQTDADRFVAVDDLAAVALADAGVEGERILVVGAIGERAFADAGLQDRSALRTRFKLGGKVALVEVTGLGAEATSQLALQLSLLEGGEQMTFLFDAAGDAESAAVLRRQVPTLGLRGKLFGATPDAPLLWRAADVIVARPRPEVVSRVMLVGGKLVALVDDNIANAAKAAAALETRKRAIPAKGLLLLASALESAFRGSPPAPTSDGGDNTADIVFAVAADKRGILDERRAAAQAATRDRVRAASAAASAAAAATAMPGDLEDLGGAPPIEVELPDAAELQRLRAEVEQRKAELTKSMMAARDGATRLSDEAKAARERGNTDEAALLDKRADAERARMHGLLGELAALETELAELDRVRKTVADAPPRPRPSASSSRSSGSAGSMGFDDFPRAPPSIDDALNDLKKRAGGSAQSSTRSSASAPSSSSSTSSSSSGGSSRRPASTVDDELAALKRKMQNAPPKKK
ncbi:MAG TPA: hypothetical protein VFQ53_02610 [Kofleriaceae bacterium]|nr:hypothetical protein [Kofleriaceae bacterium]